MPRMRGRLTTAPAPRSRCCSRCALPRRRGGGRQAVEQDALLRGPVRPLPDGRHVAVPARPEQRGPRSAGTAAQPRAAGRRSRCPTCWNLGDDSPASMVGGVGWYRKDFALPGASRALDVGGALRVGQLPLARCGSTAAASAPTAAPTSRSSSASTGLKRRGTNRLVIRVDSGAAPTDFPPSGLATNGLPTGGWWNYGGIQREVYLQAPRRVDWKPCACARGSPARAAGERGGRATLRNCTGAPSRPRERALRRAPRRPRHARRSPAAAARARSRRRSACASRACGRRRSPNLYEVNAARQRGRAHASAATGCSTGIRSIHVRRRPPAAQRQRVNLRGVGLHEDSRRRASRSTTRSASSSSPRPRRSARRSCARTTRCIPTCTSWPTSRAC